MFGGTGEVQQDARSARELDAPVEAVEEDEDNRRNDEDDDDESRLLPPADEIDLGVVKNAQHQMLSGVAPRVRFNQTRNSVRTTKMALTIEAARPASSATAKPRTGPVPNW